MCNMLSFIKEQNANTTNGKSNHNYEQIITMGNINNTTSVH